jgi:hypothetical protein
MHATNYGSYTAHHYGDYRGWVEFVDADTGSRMRVPMHLVVQLVADKVRMAKIAELEQAGPSELIGAKALTMHRSGGRLGTCIGSPPPATPSPPSVHSQRAAYRSGTSCRAASSD